MSEQTILKQTGNNLIWDKTTFSSYACSGMTKQYSPNVFEIIPYFKRWNDLKSQPFSSTRKLKNRMIDINYYSRTVEQRIRIPN